MQLVVVIAVRKAVSAATTTFTAISTILFFMTLHSSLFTRAALVLVESVASITTATAILLTAVL